MQEKQKSTTTTIIYQQVVLLVGIKVVLGNIRGWEGELERLFVWVEVQVVFFSFLFFFYFGGGKHKKRMVVMFGVFFFFKVFFFSIIFYFLFFNILSFVYRSPLPWWLWCINCILFYFWGTCQNFPKFLFFSQI